MQLRFFKVKNCLTMPLTMVHFNKSYTDNSVPSWLINSRIEYFFLQTSNLWNCMYWAPLYYGQKCINVTLHQH